MLTEHTKITYEKEFSMSVLPFWVMILNINLLNEIIIFWLIITIDTVQLVLI